jgi:hypothetical protein
MDGQLEIVSAIVEPSTRIPQLYLGEYVNLPCHGNLIDLLQVSNGHGLGMGIDR